MIAPLKPFRASVDGDRNMERNGLRVPGTLKHSSEARSDADLQKEMRAHVAAQPGIRWLADVLTALHAAPQPLRVARAHYTAFPPRQVLQAFSERADLRVRLVRAITGGPPTLLRRQSPVDLAGQIELLVAEDLPAAERALRAEEDRSLSVLDLYLKYLDPTDLATYIPPGVIFEYESHDAWWTRDSGPAGRALMGAEIKSIRKHGLVTDSELLDIIGDETIERELPVPIRTGLRAAARRAAREGRAFKDSDLFAAVRSADGNRDLTDELAEHVPLATLRKVVTRAAELLGLARDTKDAKEASKAERLDRTEQNTIPRATMIPQAASPTPPAPPSRGSAGKGGKAPAAPGPQGRPEPEGPSRSRTQPVPILPDGSPFAGEEVVGPDHVVMIDEITS
jgi:hypothetical protein